MGQIPSPANSGIGQLISLTAAVAAVESNYTAHGGEQANVGAGLVQAETDINALQAKIVVVSKAFGFADVAALGAVANGNIDFAAALPAGAIVVGAGINCTAAFDNAGDSASCTGAVGIKTGTGAEFSTAVALDAVAKVGATGAKTGALVGAITPTILVDPTVNCDTITKGAAVAYVAYILAF